MIVKCRVTCFFVNALRKSQLLHQTAHCNICEDILIKYVQENISVQMHVKLGINYWNIKLAAIAWPLFLLFIPICHAEPWLLPPVLLIKSYVCLHHIFFNVRNLSVYILILKIICSS